MPSAVGVEQRFVEAAGAPVHVGEGERVDLGRPVAAIERRRPAPTAPNVSARRKLASVRQRPANLREIEKIVALKRDALVWWRRRTAHPTKLAWIGCAAVKVTLSVKFYNAHRLTPIVLVARKYIATIQRLFAGLPQSPAQAETFELFAEIPPNLCIRGDLSGSRWGKIIGRRRSTHEVAQHARSTNCGHVHRKP
ncbi:hypothetical protein [Bradyrhizobium sp. 163]|uniref:hypothetical protein n=1 Tax=unclassified Bradyrhizobium TaxID=2631580 RepID=UPI00320A7B03